MALSITFLGTGGSSGIPQIACTCPVCSSSDPRNNRTRTSLCIHYNEYNIVIDTTPEFRIQMLKNKIDRLDAILYTHGHADHIMGLADIRQYNFHQGKPIDIYGDRKTIEHIKHSFSYIFNAPEEYKKYYPQTDPHIIDREFSINGLLITPFTVFHAKMPVLAFRFENVAYITDVSSIPDENFDFIQNLDVLILEAFMYEKHISHFSLSEAIAIAEKVAAQKTYFTHISHKFDHDTVNSMLPENIELAYDGLIITID